MKRFYRLGESSTWEVERGPEVRPTFDQGLQKKMEIGEAEKVWG